MDQDGKIAYQGPPQASGLVPDDKALDGEESEEVEESAIEKQQSLARERSEVGRELRQGEPSESTLKEMDLARQTGDTSVHKYYARAAGLKSALVFIAALIVGAFTDSFSRKLKMPSSALIHADLYV